MKRLIFGVSLTLILFSCKKSGVCELNNSTFAGSFKVKSVIYKYSSTDPGTDDFANWPACKKDDVRHIQTNFTTLHEDAGILCFPGGNSTGHWTLSGTTIVMDGQSGTVTYFDCSNTVILFPQSTPDVTITLSLIRL